MATVAEPLSTERQTTTLALEGMTCDSCATRIERRLNKLDGVEASVNFATERASVAFVPARATVGELVAAVDSAGYAAHEINVGQREHEHGEDVDALRVRLVTAVVLAVPVTVLAMVPSTRFAGWHWLCLALTTPIVFWCGAQFHRAALANARHGTATMDTLISLGTLAAWGWSTVVFLSGAD